MSVTTSIDVERRCARNANRSDRGSAMVLMPAAILVLLALAAIAVDFATGRLAHRELHDAAASAANDAVTYGLDADTFETTGAYVLLPARVREQVERTLSEEGSPIVNEALQRLEAGDGSIDIGSDPVTGLPTVVVTLRSSTKTIFARALPGGPDRLAVSARASAHVVIRS